MDVFFSASNLKQSSFIVLIMTCACVRTYVCVQPCSCRRMLKWTCNLYMLFFGMMSSKSAVEEFLFAPWKWWLLEVSHWYFLSTVLRDLQMVFYISQVLESVYNVQWCLIVKLVFWCCQWFSWGCLFLRIGCPSFCVQVLAYFSRVHTGASTIISQPRNFDAWSGTRTRTLYLSSSINFHTRPW